jgi:phasin family protein
MSSFAPEQLYASQKAGLDTTFGLAGQAVEGFERLVELNVRTFRSTLAANQEFVGTLCGARDPKEFLALQTGHLQASAERTQAYWKEVLEIVTGVRGAFTDVAGVQLQKSQQNMQSYIDSFVSHAAPGSEAIAAAWKSALSAATDSANTAYEAARKAAQQVVEAAQTDAGAVAKAATRQLPSKSASAAKK